MPHSDDTLPTLEHHPIAIMVADRFDASVVEPVITGRTVAPETMRRLGRHARDLLAGYRARGLHAAAASWEPLVESLDELMERVASGDRSGALRSSLLQLRVRLHGEAVLMPPYPPADAAE